MTAEKNKLQKTHSHHQGWVRNSYAGGKTHYYFSEEGDFSIAICGEIFPSKDLEDFMDSEYEYNDLKENYCKRCLPKYKQLLEGNEITIHLKGSII